MEVPMRRLFPLLLFALPLWAAPAPFLPRKLTPAAADLKALQGEWEYVGHSEHGSMVYWPEQRGISVYTGNRWTDSGNTQAGLIWAVSVDPTATPKRMCITLKRETDSEDKFTGRRAHFIYRLDGESLTVCAYLDGGDHSRKYPANFTPHEGVHIEVYKRKRP
jgi:uncharacterized protein (TIGR03067 family)